MFKRAVRCIVFVLVISLLLSLFAGCKCKKGVQGAASEFIKATNSDSSDNGVSSEDNTKDTSSSGSSENKTGENSSSGQSGSDTAASDTESSKDTDTNKNTDADSGNSGSSEQSGETKTLFGIPVDSEPVQGDQGPVVIVTK